MTLFLFSCEFYFIGATRLPTFFPGLSWKDFKLISRWLKFLSSGSDLPRYVFTEFVTSQHFKAWQNRFLETLTDFFYRVHKHLVLTINMFIHIPDYTSVSLFPARLDCIRTWNEISKISHGFMQSVCRLYSHCEWNCFGYMKADYLPDWVTRSTIPRLLTCRLVSLIHPVHVNVILLYFTVFELI